MSHWIWMAGAALALGVGTGAAQVTVKPGDRIRLVSAGPGERVEGVVIAAGDSVIVETADRVRTGPTGQPAHHRRAIAPGEVRELEVRRDGARQTFKGAAIGGGLGLAMGLTLGALASGECSDCGSPPSTGEIGTAALVLGGMGALVGGIAGWLTHSHRWEPAAIPVGVGVTVRF